MTAPGGQYLPPVITQLLGDASDLLRAFAEATAAQKAYADGATEMGEKVKASSRGSSREIDDFTDLVVRKMHAGEAATAVLKRRLREVGDEVAILRKRISVEGANQGLYGEFRRANDELERMRRLARQIAPELLQAGRTLAQRLGLSFAGAFANVGSLIVPAIIGAVILASPVIASLIGAAVAVGLGLGFAGLGVILAAVLLPKFQKQFGQIGKNFKKAFTGAISGVFDDELRKALRTFNLFIPTFGAQFRKIFDTVAPALDPLAKALGLGIKGFLAESQQALAQIMPSLLVFIGTIPDVMRALAQFLVTITENGPALSRFILDASNAIIAFLDSAGATIAWLEAVYLWIVKLNDAFPFIGWQRSVIGLGVAVEAVKNFFIDLWAKIVEAAKAVGSWFADIGSAVWDFLKDAGAAIADWFNTTIAWFQKLPGRVLGFLASLPGRVRALIASLAHQAAYWFGWMVGQWLRFLTEGIPRIIGWVAGLWVTVQQKMAQGVLAAVEFVKALPGQIAAFFAQLWTDVTGWVARTWESVTSWFVRTKQSMIEHIVAGINAVISWFRGLPKRAEEEVTAFRDRVVKFFKGAKDWLYEAGKNIVRGIIDGVSSMWNWAVDKVKSLASDIWHGFQDALGIHSPSTKFKDSGAMSALGYMQGWADTMRRVKGAFTGPSTADIVFGGDVAGAPRRLGTGYPGDDPRGPGMVHATFQVGTRVLVDAITPASQQRGARNGVTGTGAPTTWIM